MSYKCQTTSLACPLYDILYKYRELPGLAAGSRKEEKNKNKK
jgi:hypothetical protein